MGLGVIPWPSPLFASNIFLLKGNTFLSDTISVNLKKHYSLISKIPVEETLELIKLLLTLKEMKSGGKLKMLFGNLIII